jgi:hypothetical protein
MGNEVMMGIEKRPRLLIHMPAYKLFAAIFDGVLLHQ